MTRSRIVLCTILPLALAAAAPASAGPWREDGGAVEVVPLTTGVTPPTARIHGELGWSSINGEPLGQIQAEVRVWRTLSVMAAVFQRSDGSEPRPGAGVGYQLRDPARAPLGVRFTVNYRPEGLVEPEGEVELAVTLTRDAGRGRLTAVLTYGQDPEGNERDVESQAAYAHGWRDDLATGVTARGRRSLGDKVEGDRTWDVIGGAFVAARVRQATFHLLGGVERAGLMDGAHTGAIALFGAGAIW